jgi:glycosyltransferase involved in cell wall biosynthesis
MTPFVSVIICTYGRASALSALLGSLLAQDYESFEALVIDGNGEISPARDVVQKFQKDSDNRLPVHLIASERGLTRQRNVGLDHAVGDLICFLDDDVTFGPDFLRRTVALFNRSDAKRVGGLTGYDSLNYAAEVTLRWRLRKWLGTIPSLEPGDTDSLGRVMTVSHLQPWPGHKQIGWLPGFCMFYRRKAIENLRFDEMLPTYGGEDRDFSMRVGEQWELRICGDLLLEHHGAPQGRDSQLERVYQTGFGTGRRFAKSVSTLRDLFAMLRTIFGDSVVDVVASCANPSVPTFMTIFARNRGFWAGWVSVNRRTLRKGDDQKIENRYRRSVTVSVK